MLLVQIKRPRLIALVAAASLAGVMLITAAPTAVAENNGVGATPAMGWSSWSFIRHNPTAANIDAQADAMKSSGLATVGYNYVNIDDFWYQCPGSQGPNVDANGRWVTDASKFPASGSTNGIQVVADHVHADGLKFGIYVTPGVSQQAVVNKSKILGTNNTVDQIATTTAEKNYNCKGMVGIDYSKPGAQEFVNSWADEFASWGVDYVKIDGVGSSDIPDVQAWSNALRQTGRPIHLELSNSLAIADASTWQQYSNGWRTGGDVECYCGSNGASYPLTNWAHIQSRFAQVADWQPYGGPGGFNDYDSIEVGNGSNDGLTAPERQSQLSLWALAASPLILGTDLTHLDSTDLGYLMNARVIAIDQDAIDAKRIVSNSNQQVYSKTENNGDVIIGLFNYSDTSSQTVSVSLSAAGISGSATASDVWTGGSMGTISDTYSVNLGPGAVKLIRATPNGGSAGFPTGYHQLVVDNDGLCVDVYGASTANDAAIDQWTCKSSGQANQEFQFNPVSGGYGELQNENSSKDIVVQGASTANGAPIIQYTQNGTTNGLWQPIQLSDGSWQFKNDKSGLCLDVTGASTNTGVQLEQWTCKSDAAGTNQAFVVR
jgi:alpha-galactosidase